MPRNSASPSITGGTMLPATTSHQPRASLSRSRLPRTASQNASVAPLGRRSATAAYGKPCSTRRFSASSWLISNRAADFEKCESSKLSASASTGSGSGSSDEPRRARYATSARGSTPSFRRLRKLAIEPLGKLPAPGIGQQRQMRDPIRDGSAPSAANKSSCTPVLVMWSSPRITCVMPVSMSSTTEVNV